MQMMDVNKLVPHEKNDYFFDDIPENSEQWMAFTESIETSGIIEPLVVSETSHVIISGHQRLRAAKYLKMKQVPVTFREFKSEDEVLKELIETNIRQRGVGNPNPVKFGRCIAELERIYGIKNGGDRKSEPTKLGVKTQKELAEELSMSSEQLRKYKSLTDLIPELQDAVQSGQITPTTAMGFVKKLSKKEQEQLAEQIRGKEKVSSQEIKFYKERIKKLSEENNALRNQEPEVIEKEVEVIPDDYEKIKRENSTIRSENDLLSKERKQYLDERNAANKRIKELEEREGIHDAQIKLERESEYLGTQINSFIRNVGGYVWVTEQIEKLPEEKRMDVIKAIRNINAWSQQMLINIGGTLNE